MTDIVVMYAQSILGRAFFSFLFISFVVLMLRWKDKLIGVNFKTAKEKIFESSIAVAIYYAGWIVGTFAGLGLVFS